jgi:hypothetical protein
MEKTYKGSCFCGAVTLVVTGEPVTMGYCHCESCRHWSAGPVNGYTLWRPGAVKITAGAENIGSYSKTPNSVRKWCKSCGGHLLTEHPPIRLVDVYAAARAPALPGGRAAHRRLVAEAQRPAKVGGRLRRAAAVVNRR